MKRKRKRKTHSYFPILLRGKKKPVCYLLKFSHLIKAIPLDRQAKNKDVFRVDARRMLQKQCRRYRKPNVANEIGIRWQEMTRLFVVDLEAMNYRNS
jgi:hypothetical protein